MKRLLLGLAAVVGLWFIATDSGAQPQPPKGAKAHQLVGWPRTVEGLGLTEKEAQDDAVNKAVRRINDCLKAQDPPLTAWQADEEYVRKHLVAVGQAGEDVKLDIGPRMKVWIQPLHDPDVADILTQNERAQRRVLAYERQTIAGYVLAVLCALLAIAWGYLRVHEWTGNRLSGWLFSVGISVVALVALAAVILLISA